MRSYHLRPGAGLDSLTIREHAEPEPGPGQALVRVRATALSFRELMVLAGQYPLPLQPELVPLCEGVGEVVAIGPGVNQVKPGDRVAANVFPRWLDGPFGVEVSPQLGGSLDGLLTELAVLPEEALLPIPAHLSFVEAAAWPLVGVTAWHALFGGVPLLPGQTVLTLGTGGVSLAAAQFALVAGARVLATTSSAAKADRLRALGVHEVLNYRENPDWPTEVRRLTDGVGADHVIEVTGSLNNSVRAVARGGEVAFVGASLAAPEDIMLDPATLFTSGSRLRPLAVGSRAHFTAMNRAIATHELRPVLDRVFPFEEAKAAYEYFQQGTALGRVIITG